MGRRRKQQSPVRDCEEKPSPHTNLSILIAGTIQTVLNMDFNEKFVVEMRQKLMETPYPTNMGNMGQQPRESTKVPFWRY